MYEWKILKLEIKRQGVDWICDAEGREELHMLGNSVTDTGIQWKVCNF
jgi:hypothetical protein